MFENVTWVRRGLCRPLTLPTWIVLRAPAVHGASSLVVLLTIHYASNKAAGASPKLQLEDTLAVRELRVGSHGVATGRATVLPTVIL